MAPAAPDILPLDFGGPVDLPFEPFPYSALEGSIIDRFDLVAQRYPDRTALHDLTTQVTYAELAKRVDSIAAATLAAVAGRPGPVAVLLPFDVSFPTALLGVLAAGRPVVPLDVDHPLERNRLIAAHATAAAVVSAGEHAAQMRSLFTGDIPVVDLDSVGPAARPRVTPQPKPADLAYVLYTSGSTGAPKGVSHSHRNCLHDTLLATNIAHVSCNDRVGLYYSGVIGGFRRIFGTLLTGASLHILPPRNLGAEGLVREMRARAITIYQSVPTLYRRVVGAIGEGERLESVRFVRLAGDRVEWSDLEAFRRAFPPEARFGIALGSTECSSCYAFWFVPRDLKEEGLRLPVGRVMADLSVQILGSDGLPVADGDVGEFVVSSPHLALGYWQDPALTAKTFSTDPDDPDVRVFQTGDMGLRRPDGLLEFVGRKDQLVKIRGHRVEPAEIERALRACPGIADGVVVVRRTAAGHARSLVAYVELKKGTKGLMPRHIMAMAARSLPRFMVPAAVFIESALPRLPNFKIDRPALARLDQERPNLAAERHEDPLLNETAEAFETIVGVRGATADDNLLSLGGDSLQAVNVLMELERRFGLVVPTDVFADTRSIGELARWISARRPLMPAAEA